MTKSPNPSSKNVIKIIHINPTANSDLTFGAEIHRIKKYVIREISRIATKNAMRRVI